MNKLYVTAVHHSHDATVSHTTRCLLRKWLTFVSNKHLNPVKCLAFGIEM